MILQMLVYLSLLFYNQLYILNSSNLFKAVIFPFQKYQLSYLCYFHLYKPSYCFPLDSLNNF